MRKLSAFEEQQLKWYKSLVDNAKNKYWTAKQDLSGFIKGLREKGQNI